MSNKKTSVLLFAIAVMCFLVGVAFQKCYLEKNKALNGQEQVSIQGEINKGSDINKAGNAGDANDIANPSLSGEELQKQFAQDVYKKLPNGYILKNVDYFESVDDSESKSGAIKAIEISPCESKEGDNPETEPFCYTKITIFAEKEKTNSLEDYIMSNGLMSEWNKGDIVYDAGLIRKEYEGSVPMVYTPQRFMCIGTGGETCMRERYVYHLQSGYNVVAEVSLWPDMKNDPDGTSQNGDLQHTKMWDLYYVYKKALGVS